MRDAFWPCLLLGFGATACVTETKTTEHVTRVELPSGALLSVKKRDSNTRYQGAITGKDYGSSHSYEYGFDLDGVIWEGYSAEPKELCVGERDTLLRSLREEYVRDRERQSVERPSAEAPSAGQQPAAQEPGGYVVKERFERLVDKRYLFDLLGDAYWVEIDKERFTRASCTIYPVPNDEELELPPSP